MRRRVSHPWLNADRYYKNSTLILSIVRSQMPRWSINKAIALWKEWSGIAYLINWPQCIPGKELPLEGDKHVRGWRIGECTLWLSKSNLPQTERSGCSFFVSNRVKSAVIPSSSEGSNFPDVFDPFAFSRVLRRSTMGFCGLSCRLGTEKQGRRGGNSSKPSSSTLSIRSSGFKQNHGGPCSRCLAMQQSLKVTFTHLVPRCLRMKYLSLLDPLYHHKRWYF